MTLFEVTNGFMGESYVRVYVWATDEVAALDLAREAYRQRAGNDARHWSNLECRALFNGSDAPFATIPDDAGWETEKVTH